MLGLGEKDEEVIKTMQDLRAINVDIITIGQYLRPTNWHIAVNQYIPPQKFDYFRQKALELGFLFCASGPFVRSSYKAGELFVKNVLRSQQNL